MYVVIINPLYVAINTGLHIKEFSEIYPYISVDEMQRGDIVLARSFYVNDFIPGYWAHSAIYVGDVKGVPSVIESTAKKVHISSLEEFVKKEKHVIIGVNKIATPEQKLGVVKFAYSALGRDFDLFYSDKQLDGDKYYCSEFLWVAYKKQGIEIDSEPGFSWKAFYGVSPQEIFENSDFDFYNLNLTS